MKRTLRVSYPGVEGRLVLRTELDWGRDIEPIAVSKDGNTATFELEAKQPFLYFKPCLVKRHVSTGRSEQTISCSFL